MTARTSAVDDEHQAEMVRKTVRRTDNHWRRAGVPRKVRRQKADELRDHLEAAVAEGRAVHEVTGRDLAAFAAAWAQAEVRRPWLEPLLAAVFLVTAMPGAVALVLPLVDDQDRVGIPGDDAVFLVMLWAFLFGLQLVRWFRAKLTIERTAIVVLVLIAAYFVPAVLISSAVAERGWFVAIPPPVAWSLVAIGIAAQGLATGLKRTGRL